MTQQHQNPSDDDSANISPVLLPLGPQIAADDPDGRGDDWEEFRRRAKKMYPGIDLTGIDPDDVRKWIDDIRRRLKRKGNG